MNKLAAVFWDVDGTIADTELCGHRVAFNLAFNDFDLDWYWDEINYLKLLKISGGLNRIIHYRDKVHSEIDNEYCSMIQLRKRFHYKQLVRSGKINIRIGVSRLIKELAGFGIKQFIVTTSGRESLEPFLETSFKSLESYFSEIITYEDVSRHKPFPEAYDLAVKLSNESRKSCIAIEDSKVGVEAAKAANISCLLTLPPWSSVFHNISKDANACLSSLGDKNNEPKLIYGKQLANKIVDYSYLSNVIN
tara:strand:- start:3717 stop:4463 length:747 start_codon:yes stop_codon:yes gene_type:complete